MFINSRLNDKKKYNLPFGVLFIDIDNMHSIIDNYGSVVSDKMVRMISQTLGNNIRFFEKYSLAAIGRIFWISLIGKTENNKKISRWLLWLAVRIY